MPLSSIPVVKKPMSTRGRVLVVDDDPIVLEATCETLNEAGFQASGRSQALGTSQWIAEHQDELDFILLDVMMPALSGVELAGFLRKRGLTKKVGVILHSSKGTVELADIVRQTGALGAIGKTGDKAAFLTEFERLGDRRPKKM